MHDKKDRQSVGFLRGKQGSDYISNSWSGTGSGGFVGIPAEEVAVSSTTPVVLVKDKQKYKYTGQVPRSDSSPAWPRSAMVGAPC